jgi:hypothetical protein
MEGMKMKHTEKEKIQQAKRLAKHYREAMWDAERDGNKEEVAKIWVELRPIERFLEDN